MCEEEHAPLAALVLALQNRLEFYEERERFLDQWSLSFEKCAHEGCLVGYVYSKSLPYRRTLLESTDGLQWCHCLDRRHAKQYCDEHAHESTCPKFSH